MSLDDEAEGEEVESAYLVLAVTRRSPPALQNQREDTDIATYLLVLLHHGLLFQKFLHHKLLLSLPLLVVLLRLLRR